ncbi:hypothetical protein [Herbaspirillum rubrisubalbicans]|uniref:hypothetical protein n=1 Tax=Herbaspirillum rubrisubalbicans TaxID=80842 RepID=UPI0015C56A18|nr:hypothetical protein [Herbaspirillum rubrisubalbicans]NQE50340.1 hypothetical protein [Herbaspirillum rubrisubalbicans]
MDELLWSFEKRLELLWQMERSGESIEEVAAQHSLEVDLLIYWKALYDAVSNIKLDPMGLLAAKAALENQTLLLEKLALELKIMQLKSNSRRIG